MTMRTLQSVGPSTVSPAAQATLVTIPVLVALALGVAAGADSMVAVGALLALCGALFALVEPQFILLALVLGRATVDAFAESHLLPAGGADIRGTFLINVALVGTAVLMVTRKLAAPRTAFFPWPLRFLLLFTVWVWLSTLWSIDFSETWHDAFRLLATVAAAFLAANIVWADVRWANRLAVASLAAAIVPSCAALYQAATGTGMQETETLNRAFGTLNHPNDFAIFSAFVGIAGINLALDARASMRRAWPFVVATLLVVVSSYFAYGRSALVCLVLGGLVSVWLRGGGLRRRLRQFAGIGVVLALLAVPFARGLGERFAADQERLAGWSVGDVHNPVALSPMQFRIYVWSLARDMFVRAPVIGNGWGSFSRYFAHSLSSEIQLEGQNPHNDYLRVVSETGGIGLGLFLLATLSALHAGLRGRKRGVGGMWPATVIGLMTAYLACSLAINVFASTAPPFYFWVLIATGLAAIAREQSPEQFSTAGSK